MVCGDLRISYHRFTTDISPVIGKTSVEDSVVNLSQDFSLWLIFAPLIKTTKGDNGLFFNVQNDEQKSFVQFGHLTLFRNYV